jgi:hypothetical protein
VNRGLSHVEDSGNIDGGGGGSVNSEGIEQLRKLAAKRSGGRGLPLQAPCKQAGTET